MKNSVNLAFLRENKMNPHILNDQRTICKSIFITMLIEMKENLLIVNKKIGSISTKVILKNGQERNSKT